MSHYIYRLFINFLLIHYFIYRLVRWSDPQYRCRPSDTLGFRCSIAIPAILLSTLSLHVTVTDSRLASNAVVNSLFDGASTHRTIYPLLDARSDPNVGYIPAFSDSFSKYIAQHSFPFFRFNLHLLHL